MTHSAARGPRATLVLSLTLNGHHIWRIEPADLSYAIQVRRAAPSRSRGTDFVSGPRANSGGATT